MRWWAIVRHTLASLVRRRRTEAALQDEFRDHLEREIEYNLQSGMPPEEARRAALRLIGPVSFQQEECRDWRGTAFFEICARDLRYAFQMLRRTPLFAAAAILTLGLGIGANTTVFTFVDNILLRPVPARDPRQLVSVHWGGMVNVSYPDYVDLRGRNRSFSGLIAYRFNVVSLSVAARENYRAWGYETTGNYFETLGVRPLLGRFFGPAEDGRPNADPVLVISYRFWRSRFAGDTNVVGRETKVNGFPFTIIGVAPPGFEGTELIVAADYWVPMSMVGRIEPRSDWLESRYARNIWTIGRLRPGVSHTQAEADLDRIGRDLTAQYPDIHDRNARFRLSPPGLLGDALRRPIAGFGVVLMSVGGLVLLLACVNLAGMLTARAADRRREIAIRLALGAGKARLLRQLMTESLLLAAIGGLLGFGLAVAACRLFSGWRLNIDIPLKNTIQPDWLVLAFTSAAALLTTLLFGLIPALQAVRTDLIPSLKNAPAKRFRGWGARDLIVTGQIALSVILVICSALVVRSLQRAMTLNLGFQPAHAVSASFDLSLQGYDTNRGRSFDATLVARAAALPGIQAAGIINNFPLRISEDNSVVSRTDRPVPPPEQRIGAVVCAITPGYLQAAGTRMMAGREFTARDRAGASAVALVNQAFADHLYPNEDPLGRHFRTTLTATDPGFEIVGVVETGKYESLGEDPKPAIFRPVEQTGTSETTLVVRTALPAPEAAALLRKTILDLDPELTVYRTGSLEEQLALPLFPARAAAVVLGVFGLLAMVLAATGLFALVAYAVSRRTREIGIRMALGARAGLVLSSVLRRTLVLCAVGLCAGTLATLAAGRLLSAILYGISPRDPGAYMVAILLMVLVTLLACCHPASRAIRIDPARTLRED